MAGSETNEFCIEGYTVKSPIVTGLDKSIAWKVPKDAGKRSFLDTVIKNAKGKQAPGQYNLEQGFKTDPKKIHFAINKTKRESTIIEESKRKEFIPAPNVYSPKNN